MTISRRLRVFFGIAMVILLIPLIAMQFTTEVNWNITDFIVAGVLLFGTSILVETVLTKSNKYKTLLIVTIIVILLLIWMELAVGIFSSPMAGS